MLQKRLTSSAADVRLDVICESLFSELIQDKQPRYAMIARCNLTHVLWSKLSVFVGIPDSPSILFQ